MELNERIYYIGDDQNPSGWGYVSKIEYFDDYGLLYDVKMKDGRHFMRLPRASFDRGHGHKFKTIDQYREDNFT